jgi:hypothetical protein
MRTPPRRRIAITRVVVITVALIIATAACAADPSPTPTSSASPDSSLVASPSPEPPLAGVTAGRLAYLGYPVQVTTGILHDERTILAPEGVVYVVAGPRDREGRLTYQILWRPPDPDAPESEMAFGWIDARRADGTPMLSEWVTECPEPPVEFDSLLAVRPDEWAICFGTEPFEVTAFPGSGCRESDLERAGVPEWLYGTYRSAWLVGEPTGGDGTQGGWIEAYARPGVELPCEGDEPLRLTVHVGDPEAATCRATVGTEPRRVVDPDLSTVLCRLRLVVDEVEIGPEPSAP